MKYSLAILVLFCTLIRANNRSNLLMMPVKPLNYNLYIDISLGKSSFSGNVEINFELLSHTDNITLDASQLNITHMDVFHGKQKREINSISQNNDIVYMIFNPRLDSGMYTIKIGYNGNFNTSMVGLYASNYYDNEDGFSEAVAVIYFQPTYAKNAFPCFDDPKLKANFNISISRDKDNIAISNMPLKLSKDMGNNRVLDIFEVSPKFSTNQVTFAVCNYPNPTSYARGNIYTNPRHDNNFFRQKYLADVSERIFEIIQVFFSMLLPMEKIDIMSVPVLPRKDCGMGNWGLILLSEENLFVNNKVKETMGEQNTLMTLIHVYLHELLDNVCNEAEDGCSWLNEGMAIFLQYLIGDQLRPDWRLLEQRALILLRDAVETNYAMFYDEQVAEEYLPTDLKAELNNYKKAAAILLTLQSTVRRHIFQLGVQHFAYRSMAVCSFGRTFTANDFWISLQEAIDTYKPKLAINVPLKIKNIAKIMKTWEQDAIPVLYVRRNYTAPFEIKFEQTPLYAHEDSISYKWHLPINYATPSNPWLFKILSPKGGFLEPSKPYTFPDTVRHDEWLIVNVEAAYLYLVNYDNTNWKRLANALNSENFGNIPPLTRGKLLYDAFTLAMFGRLKYSVALELVKYVGREKDYIPLNSLFHVLEFFYSRFAGIADFHYLEAFLAKSLQPALEHVGFQAQRNQHIDNLNRLQLIKWLCLLGNQFCRKTTTKMLLGNFFTPPDLPPPDLKEVVICAGLIEADSKVWNRLKYINDNEEDEVITNGFECSQNEHYLTVYIESNMRKHIPVFHKIYSRGYFGTNFVLKYLVHNWRLVYETLMDDDKEELVRGIARHVTTDIQLSMLQNISTQLPMPQLEDTFKQAVNKATQKVAWVKLHSADITEWIKKEFINKPGSTETCHFMCFFKFY